jgi:acyl CoA:acetate/3-ketoacid CoA transferase alpha subunit
MSLLKISRACLAIVIVAAIAGGLTLGVVPTTAAVGDWVGLENSSIPSFDGDVWLPVLSVTLAAAGVMRLMASKR